MLHTEFFAIASRSASQYVTSGGRVIIHDNRNEMEFLFPQNTIVPFKGFPHPDDTIALFAVPGMEAVQFPLRKEDFR